MMSLDLTPIIFFFIDCYFYIQRYSFSHHVFNILAYIMYTNVSIWCESVDVVQNISYKKVENYKFHLSVSRPLWNNPFSITYKC